MNFKHTCIAAAALLVAHASYSQTNSDVAAEMKQLRDELRQLRLEMQALKSQQSPKAEPAPVAAAPTSAPAPVPPAVMAAMAPSPAVAEAAPNAVNLFGYGELNMTRPRHNASEAVATARQKR